MSQRGTGVLRIRPRRPGPLLQNMAPEQRDVEAAVKSALADFLANLKTLSLGPRRLLLVLFEYHSAVRLYREKVHLGKAIQAMAKALKAGRRGRSVKDLDALDEIWRMIERDRRRRGYLVYSSKLRQRNQELSNRVAKIRKPEFLFAFHSHHGFDAEIATSMAKDFDVSADTIARRIRRYRAQGVLPRHHVTKSHKSKAVRP